MSTVFKREILVVEDDPATAELERRALTRAGIKAYFASGVGAAKALLRQRSFAAVLLDYQLPDGDPWDVVEVAQSLTPKIPVVLVTAMGNERIAAEAIQRGVSEYIRKSDDFWDHLSSAVDRVATLASAEERLRRSDALFQLIADNALDVIMTLSPDGKIQYASPACRRMLGYDMEELVGSRILDLAHADDRAATFFGDRPAGHEPSRNDIYRCRRKDGEYVWVEANLQLIRHAEDAEPAEVIGVIRDISARKRMESGLAAATAEAIAARDEAEVARRQATEARIAAETANRAKSEFLSRMSHELRTPLNAIMGFAQMLQLDRAGALTAKQRAYSHYILSSGQDLLGLIDEVLDLATIEAGRIKLSIERVAVAAALGRVATTMAPPAAKAGVKLEVSAVRGIPDVRADDLRLRQVLVNLLSNAIKYNRPDGRVTVTAMATHDERVRFLVADTGVGIAPEHHAGIFEPFNRAGAQHTAVEGTGIGLTLAKRLVEAMGGAIGFSSEPGSGSTFWIDVPVEAAAEVPSDARPNATIAAKPRCTATDAYSVLYVEDNPANLRLIEHVLSTMPNVTMLGAPTPQLGLDLAAAHRPDVIVLDLNLPGMSGFEALARLRKMPETRHIPVMALTAAAMPNDVQKGIAAGFYRYLTKPVDVNAFLAAVDEALASTSARRGARG